MRSEIYRALGAILSRVVTVGDEILGHVRVIADACTKELPGIDYARALRAMRRNAGVPPGGDERKHLRLTLVAGRDERAGARHREPGHVHREERDELQIAVHGAPVAREDGAAELARLLGLGRLHALAAGRDEDVRARRDGRRHAAAAGLDLPLQLVVPEPREHDRLPREMH